MSRPLILLSNDDGYRSRGIQAMQRALAEFAEVIVCAPEIEQSATSHALSVHRALRLFEPAPGVFSIDGTPADCVYVALHGRTRILPRWPDIVVSGVNHGVNLGDDVFYSGTVAAAREAALKGIPAMAVSAPHDADMDVAASLAQRVTQALLFHQITNPLLLNLNVPKGYSSVRSTRLGRRIYHDEVHFRLDPRGREYMWLGGAGVDHPGLSGSDVEAFDAGIASLTPLALDLWARESDEFVARILSDLG
ncbi:MAG TPA: 5'/3'-nucleotidase SurE [Polyangiaceae bacterium]|jgi:5'-nucleotidase